MLAEYERIQPGLAAKIVERADKEMDFRHEMGREDSRLQHRTLAHKAWQGYAGQAFAFIVATIAIGGGIYLIATGKSTGGLVAILGALVALTAAIITGKLVEVKKSRPQSADPADDEASDDEI